MKTPQQQIDEQRINTIEVICEACMPYICAHWDTPPLERVELCPQLKKWEARILFNNNLYLRVVTGRGDFNDNDEACTMHYEYISLKEME